MMQQIPEWIKAAALFLTSVGGFVAVIFGIREKIKAKDSNHAKGFDKTAQIIETINEIPRVIPDCKLVSVAIVRNGGHRSDPTEPKYFTVRFSTDFPTWQLYNDWQQMEQDLVLIHNVTIDEGYCLFFPKQLKNPETHDWYTLRGIEKTTSLLIGVNQVKGQSLVLYVNWGTPDVVSSKTREQIRLYVRKLQTLFEPEGWLAKKNFLTV